MTMHAAEVTLFGMSARAGRRRGERRRPGSPVKEVLRAAARRRRPAAVTGLARQALLRGRLPCLYGRCLPASAEGEGEALAVGLVLGVEGAVGGGEGAGAAVDDAVVAGRALGARAGPAEGPAGLQVAAAGEDGDVLAEHVAGEGDGAGLVVAAGRAAALQDAVLADDAVSGHQRRGRPPLDGPGGAEEGYRGPLQDDGQVPGARRARLRRRGIDRGRALLRRGHSGGAACQRE